MVKTPNIAFSGHTQIDGYCIKKSVWKYLPIPCEMSTSWGWERIIFYVLGGMVLWCCSATQLCPTLCGTMDCSPPDSSVLGISQAGILKWDTMPSSRESSRQRDQTWVCCVTYMPVSCLPWSHRGSPIGWNEQWQITSHTQKRKKKTPCFNSIYKVNWKILKTDLILEKEICIFKDEIRLNTLTSRKMKFMTKTFRDPVNIFLLKTL